MHDYKAKIYGPPQGEATLCVRASSAIEAAKNLWVALHGDSIGFNFSQAEQNSSNEVCRDNAHAQWMGGHAGIHITRS